MAKTKTWLALVVASTTGWGVWSLGKGILGDDSTSEDTRWIVNRMWIERIPQDERDMVGRLALVQQSGTRVGIAGRASQWRFFFELFKWGLERDRLSLYFPQEEVKAHVKVRTWRCEGEAPEPFELCLEIAAGRRKAIYYSREDWELDGNDVEGSRRRLATTNPELGRVFEHAVVDAPLEISDSAIERFEETSWLPPVSAPPLDEG